MVSTTPSYRPSPLRSSAGHDAAVQEMSIEISRWGDPAKEDARYLLQHYYVAANVHRFNEPAGTLTEVAP
jgi:hypothetical protein